MLSRSSSRPQNHDAMAHVKAWVNARLNSHELDDFLTEEIEFVAWNDVNYDTHKVRAQFHWWMSGPGGTVTHGDTWADVTTLDYETAVMITDKAVAALNAAREATSRMGTPVTPTAPTPTPQGA